MTLRRPERPAVPRSTVPGRAGQRAAAVLSVVLLVAGCTAGERGGTGPTDDPSGGPAPLASGLYPDISADGSPAPVPAPVVGGPSPDAWADGLPIGPNGPIPAIVVDQFGYRPEARKVAVLRRPRTGYDVAATYVPSGRAELVDADSGATVLSGRTTAWNRGAQDPISGDRAWWFDFSEVTRAGSYFVQDPESGVRSPQFVIGDQVYAEVLTHALRTFFYQRAGQEKLAEHAGEDWADAASHLGPGQDPQSRAWLRSSDRSRDLRGGWYDAGDYNKYTAWHASYVIALLSTYREHPTLVGDDTGIPESGNGTSDLLDEIDWGLQWLARMQQADGSVLSIQGLDRGSPPSAATGPSHYGPASTHATRKAAAAFASAASVYRASGVPALVDDAADLARRAAAAWRWSEANPDVTFHNNDETLQPGSGGLGAGQQEVDDAGRARSRFEAAVHLFALTGQNSLRRVIDSTYASQLPEWGPSQWTVAEQEALLHYASLPRATRSVAREIRTDYLASLESDLFLGAAEGGVDPYRAPIADYTWGSNQSKAAMGRMLLLGRAYGLDGAVPDRAAVAAEDYVHYIHGVNPLGLVYLTNMAVAGAEHSASTLYHHWFADGTVWDEVTGSAPGPPPGFLVGGPNPDFTLDACCAGAACSGSGGVCSEDFSPPLGQPAMKSYLQFNTDWPANSWQVTENSNGYQVQYIRLLASFAG